MSGTLSYDPADGLRLDVNSQHTLQDLFGRDAGDAILNGKANDDYWTLADCLATQSRNDSMSLHVGYAIAGVGLEPSEVGQFTELRLSFHELRPLTRFGRRRPGELDAAPRPLVAELPGGLRVSLESVVTSIDDGPDRVSYHDQLQFVVQVDSEAPFDRLVRLSYQPLRDLLMLMSQSAVALSYCALCGPATTHQVGSREILERCPVYWNVRPIPLQPKTIPRWPLLQLENTQAEFEKQLTAWFSLHEALELPISLRTANLASPAGFAEMRFMLAIQALEALHRRIHPDSEDAKAVEARDVALKALSDHQHRALLQERLAHVHEPTLRRRLRELLVPISSAATEVLGNRVAPVINRMVTTRNAITHWSPTAPHPLGIELSALQRASEALFDLQIFRLLGEDEPKLEQLARSINAKQQVQYWLDRAATETG